MKIHSGTYSFKTTLLIFSLLLYAVTSVHAQADDSIAQARLKLREAVQEQAKLQQATVSQDVKAARVSQSRITELRREARDMFNHAGAGETEDMALLIEYASLLEQTADYDLAAKALERAVSSDPTPELWLRLGSSLSRLSEASASDAIAALNECLLLNPDDTVRVACISKLGELYFRLGLFEIATKRFGEVIEVDDSNVPARVYISALAVREGQMLHASTMLDAMGRLDPAADALLRQSLNQALLDFERGRLWFPDASPDHFAYGKLLFRVGRLPECALALERSLSLDSQNYVGWNILGSVTMQMGDTVRSREAFGESIRVNPDQPRTRDVIKQLDAELE